MSSMVSAGVGHNILISGGFCHANPFQKHSLISRPLKIEKFLENSVEFSLTHVIKNYVCQEVQIGSVF